MKRRVVTAFLLSILLGISAFGQWAEVIGGAELDAVNDQCIRPTSDGGFILAGYTQSFGLGGNDGWIAKLDANGVIIWQEAVGGRVMPQEVV